MMNVNDQIEESTADAGASFSWLQSVLSGHAEASSTKKATKKEPSLPYSHGLEDIYAIETIDINTIRPLGSKGEEEESTDAPLEVSVRADEAFQETIGQLEFDFGLDYRGWLSSFVLNEPIRVLELPSMLSAILNQEEKKTIGDLVDMDFSDLTYVRGVGQGHIDELEERLQNYLLGRTLHRCKRVDWFAFLRGAIGERPMPLIYPDLSKYGLGDLFALTAPERVECSRKKDTGVGEIFKDEQMCVKIKEQLGRVFQAFCLPWIRNRQGMATRDELKERLERVSVQVKEYRLTRAFIEKMMDGELVEEEFIPHFQGDLFFYDSNGLEKYDRVLQLAKGYFYRKLSYPLPSLLSWIEREASLSWESFPYGFVEKVLRYAPQFSVCLGGSGEVTVQMKSRAWSI